MPPKPTTASKPGARPRGRPPGSKSGPRASTGSTASGIVKIRGKGKASTGTGTGRASIGATGATAAASASRRNDAFDEMDIDANDFDFDEGDLDGEDADGDASVRRQLVGGKKAVRAQRREAEEEDEDEAEGAADSDEEEARKTIPPKLLMAILYEFFEKDGTRITKGANEAVVRYMEVFVQEAIARVVDKKRDAEFLEVEDLEKIAPQLLLDL